MTLLLIRNELSYFQSYKDYFIAIYITFLVWPIGDLVFIIDPQPVWMRLATQGIITSGALIAIIWGYVSTKLYMYPQTLSVRRLFSRPIRPIFLIYGVYLVPMVLALVAGWTDPLLINTNASSQVTYILEGVMWPAAPVGSSLLVVGGAVVIAFTLYPLAVLSRRRALAKDSEVRQALRIIAVTFSVISVTLMLAIGIVSFGYSVIGSANLLSVVLLIVVVRAFRKPTFLKTFLGVVPSLESSPSAAHFDQMILIHRPGDEKFGPIAKYIIEGVNQRERVIYFHNSDVALITEGLARDGVDVTRMMLKGSLRVPPLGSVYPKKGVLDDTPLEAIQELALEAKTLGNEGLRVIMDYGDFIVRPAQRFVQHLADQRWSRPDHSLHVLMVFDSTAFRGEEASLAQLERQIRTLDMAETQGTFSQAVGLDRQEVVGRKILLEYDPQGNYQRVFKSILAENASNFERTVVFTRKETPLYSLARRQPGTKIFVLTSRVSYPKMESENLFLLPSYDSSLLLDSLNKTIDAYMSSSFTIILDNISHFIFTIGQERTHSLVRQALELMVSDKITAVFSVNSEAHDQKTLSKFENMFDVQIVSKFGARAPEVRRRESVTV